MTKPFYNINDTHGGAVRSAGTTARSAWALRLWIIDRFKTLLQAVDGDMLINGDLFDAFSISYLDLLSVFWGLNDWLRKGHHLYLSPGNHDLSKTTATMSSFQFMCSLFAQNPQVTILNEPGVIDVAGNPGYVIPHLPNQDLFDIELGKVPKGTKYLFLHCNFDNKFSQAQDNSLNLSTAQAMALEVDQIILGHEHQRKSALAGKIVVVGNQIPTSVADCLGNDAKYMLRITPTKLEHLPVWEAKGSFHRADWRELADVPADAQFVRVQGDATPAEAPAAVSAISKLRSTHEAFVITNAVQITERDSKGEKLTLEQIQGYDVLTALMKRLTPEQGAAVNQLLETENG